MIKGFYFITDSKLTKKTPVEDVESALKAGVKVVQYREDKPKKEEALRIKELCQKYSATFLINNDVKFALEVGADGVHLGQNDMPYEEARKLLGDKIIGVTAHNVEEAVEAEKKGADYLGLSPIFATTTKLDAGKPAGIQLIEDVKKVVKIPVAAIGGINESNIDEVIKAKPDAICAISATVARDDVEEAVKNIINRMGGVNG